MIPSAETHDAFQERVVLLVIEFLLTCATKSGALRCPTCAIFWRRRHPFVPCGYVVPAMFRDLQLQIRVGRRRVKLRMERWEADMALVAFEQNEMAHDVLHRLNGLQRFLA